MPTGARISFGVYDETAKDEASYYAASGSAQSWVDYSEIKDGLSPDENPDEFGRYISGEPGVYRLDGSSRLFPGTPAGCHLGYWSASMSGSNRLYPTSPMLSCGFASLHTSIGITIHFDGTTHLSAFTVRWLYNGSVKSSVDVSKNTLQTVFVENHVEGFNGLQVIATLTDEPYRYVKIQEIDFGQKMVYDGETLVSASVIEEADLSGGSVPANSLRVTVLDPDHRLNPVNPDGIYTYLRKGMPLTVEFLRDGTAYPGGVYYLDTWEGTNTGTAKLTAEDVVGLKADESYASAFYAEGDGFTMGQLLADVLAVCGIPGSADPTIGAGVCQGYIPETEAREAISHICVAGGGFARTGRDGSLLVSSLPEADPAVTLGEGDILGEPTITKTDAVTGVFIEVYRYVVGPDTIYDAPLVQPGPTREYYKYTFDWLGHNISCSVEPEFNRPCNSIMGRIGYNFVTFEAWAEEDPGPTHVITQGDLVTESSCQKGTQPDAGGRAVQVSGIRLISNTNSEAVMARLKGYYAKALKVKLRTPWVPGMDCGTRISVPTRFGPVVGNIRRMDIDLTGGLLANVEVVA